MQTESDLPAVREFAAAWKTCPSIGESREGNNNQIKEQCDFLLGANLR